MSYRDVIARAWTGYRALWHYLVPLALVVYLALGAFAVFVALVLGPLGLVSALVMLALGYIWMQGVLVKAIDDIQAREHDLWVGTRLNRLGRRVNALSLGTIVAGVGIGVGLVFLLVPGLVLATWWALLVPVVVLEGKGAFAALRRSRDLVRGHGRLVFNVLFAVGILTGVATKVVEKAGGVLPGPEAVSALLAELVGASLVAPFAALATAVLYYELRDGEDA